MSKVVLGLSGGVDSAVAARLLQRDQHKVFGLFLDIGTEDGRRDAISTAEFLEIPLKILDIRDALETHVCAPFLHHYLQGETPNPCILCNPTVKFQQLLTYADTLGAEWIATGHYARAEAGSLFKGHPSNDQSYMLSRLRPEQVCRLLLPLGSYEKAQVRALAEEFHIPVAHKPDSMEICFIPDKDYIGWISRRAPVPPPGDILFDGAPIGRHEGIHRYTVGQRLPGLYRERKIYVGALRPEINAVVAVLWEELFKRDFYVADVSWLIDPPSEPLRGSVRVRHTKWENPGCTLFPDGDLVRVHTDEPVRAPAPGQAAAFYDDTRLIGGGRLIASDRPV